MASTTSDLESALRTSLLGLLHHTTHGMESALDIADAIASALDVVHKAIADFAEQSNSTRTSVFWNRIPPEIKLETTRWLPRTQHRTMLGVSRNTRNLLIADTSRWTKITFPRVDYEMEDTEPAEFLQTIVPRSGQRAVDLDWVSECVRGPDAARDAVLAVLPRVRTLVLHTSYFPSGPQTFWTAHSPLLERLTITDGTRDSYIALDPAWPAKDMPLLRHLKLGAASFTAQPLATPFASVVHLEAAMGTGADGDCWARIWDWFPHLERLVAHVDDFASIPSPPPSVQHVTLVGGISCRMPAHVVRKWAAHRVRTLEILGSYVDKLALDGAVQYLQNCEPDVWTASFVPSCCDERRFPISVILRGQRSTVVVKSRSAPHYADQIRDASRTILFDRIVDLTLSGPAIEAMLDLCPMMPGLRSLTVVGTAWMVRLAQSLHPGLLCAPALKHLVVDVSHEADPGDPLHMMSTISTLLSCIGNPRGLRITQRSSGTLHGPASVASSGRAPFDCESSVLEKQHDYPCVLYRREDGKITATSRGPLHV